jgi:hypothetical protein
MPKLPTLVARTQPGADRSAKARPQDSQRRPAAAKARQAKEGRFRATTVAARTCDFRRPRRASEGGP